MNGRSRSFFKIFGWTAICALLAAILFAPHYSFAQVQISASIPGSYDTSGAGTSPSAFIANFYQYALSIAGIIAFGIIVYGGVRYMVSVGNPSGESDAKEWIKAAIMGLLLLAGAYLILNIVNPNLVNLTLPPLQPSGAVTQVITTLTTPTGTCPIAPLPTLTDPQAIAMENGQTVIWNSSNPFVQANLVKLQSAVNRMQSMLSAQGVHMTVNSAYRPLAYQAYLYAIYQDAIALRNNPGASSNSACTAIISQLQAEEAKHGVCNGNGPCLVAAPSGCSDHPKGMGVDISIPQSMYGSINSTLSAKGIDLRWAALTNDPVHFRLTDPAYTACVSS